jgi:hypothetical protein
MPDPTSETRRSLRVLLRVPLRITFAGSNHEAETAVVNGHGALLLSRADYAEGAALVMTNLESNRIAACRVVWSGGPGPRGLFRIGVELPPGTEDFWGPDYDRLAEAATATPSS